MILRNLYFYTMWQIREQNFENWVLLLVFFLFVLISQLYRLYRIEASYFIRLFDFNSYLRLFGKDRDLSIWRPFQIGITLFLVLTFSLLITLIWSDYSGHSLRLNFFFQCLGVVTTLILIRYLLLWALAWIFNLNMLFKQLVFKGVSSYGYLALIVYGLCVLYYFSPWQNSSSLLWLGLAVLEGGNLLIQGVQYIGIGKGSTSQTVYLFLYICCFKIAPWIWIYRWIDIPL